MMNPKEAEENFKSILSALRGQSVVLPDLNAIFDGWPREISRHYDQLHRDLDDWLDSVMAHSPKLRALQATEFAYMGCAWWPQAPYERLRIATFLMAWFLAWDDELDAGDGSLRDHLELANLYRHETRNFVRTCLGLASDPQLPSVKPGDATIQAFEIIGKAIHQAYNYEQRQRFMDKFEHFLDMTHQEQMVHLRNTRPSVEEFWQYRLGTSAVYVTNAMIEFTWGNMRLRTSVMENTDMRLLWDYTNIIISTVNDICSLKKEIAQNNAGNLVTLFYAEVGDLQMAMDQATDFLVANVKAFEETAKRLQETYEQGCDNSEESHGVRDFIQGCYFNCIGNLTWSLITPRYGILNRDLSAGLSVTL